MPVLLIKSDFMMKFMFYVCQEAKCYVPSNIPIPLPGIFSVYFRQNICTKGTLKLEPNFNKFKIIHSAKPNFPLKKSMMLF